MKTNPCKTCGSTYHTAFTCPTTPKATLQTKTRLIATKPLNKIGRQGKRTSAAVAKWKRHQKPNHQGRHTCYLCGKETDYLMAEHVNSKARRPDLRTDLNNLQPACADCNEKKGSQNRL